MLRKEFFYNGKYIHAVFYWIYLHALVLSSEIVLKLFIILRSRLCHLCSLFFMDIVYLLSFNAFVLVQPVRLSESHQTIDMMYPFLWNSQVAKCGFSSIPKFKFECIDIGTDHGSSLHASAEVSENYYACLRKSCLLYLNT